MRTCDRARQRVAFCFRPVCTSSISDTDHPLTALSQPTGACHAMQNNSRLVSADKISALKRGQIAPTSPRFSARTHTRLLVKGLTARDGTAGLLPSFGARITGAKRRRARAGSRREYLGPPPPLAPVCLLACLSGRRRLIFAQSFDVMDRRLVRHLAPLI